ncbi:hypothetical protein GQ53DRAFT_779920 [Thozetella sp. PMI_491]|nr:hypothetical protein GQ53DRAFT_779920 [Thozetella sp. PMI_491]
MTVDEGAQLRRRPTGGHGPPGPEFASPRRRSSNFSDYSLNEARRNLRDDILNPGAGDGLQPHPQGNLSMIPLAFALLPAAAGLLFKNGSAVVTDAMLLVLAAVFLHWSVTQPWSWYHSAQEIRVREEQIAEKVFEDESEGDDPGRSTTPPPPSSLDDVPEDEETPPRRPRSANSRSQHTRKALQELYLHEVTALVSCFMFPPIAAYLLHAIRSQLSRPSEGLVSNYNLTIFLLAAEIHPLSHLFKLVQARTLHLQRIVSANLYQDESSMSSAVQVQELVQRLGDLEVRALSGELTAQNGTNPEKQARQEAAMVREVRNAIQPELDALNRAVRRYEKKATVLALQTESRLSAMDGRLNDAITLAAAAAKNSASRGNFSRWLADQFVWLIMMPFHGLVSLLILPFRGISALLGRSRKPYEKAHRDRRSSKSSSSSSRLPSSDRVPSRLSKR